jgi:hypothetical protein
MSRKPVPPLKPGWVIANGLPMFHRSNLDAGDAAEAMVHVHGFGISGTYLEPTAALLAPHYRTFVPDLPGMGRSIRPEPGLDLPGLARALMAYCDAVGVERPILVGKPSAARSLSRLRPPSLTESSVRCLSPRLVALTTNHSAGLLDKWLWTGCVSRHRCCRSQHATTSGSGHFEACRCSGR